MIIQLKNDADYRNACKRFEEIREAEKDTPEYKEMLILVNIISMFEENLWDMPEISATEFIAIRKEEFGYEAK
jgi:HTH-type transcriptional regulator / antitoxin HigA